MIKLDSHKNLQNFYRTVDFSYPYGVQSEATLTEDVMIDYHGWRISFKAGFKWDGSSLPGFKRWRLNNPFDYLLASLFHDTIYGEQPEWCPKFYADYIYGKLMLYEGAPRWQAWLRVMVLWLFGYKAWNLNKELLK